MINIRTLKKMAECDGLTLKNGKPVTYKTGYQVADYGYEFDNPNDAIKKVRELKTCGIWYSNGIYYIDHSFRVSTKKQALAIGKANNQQSVLKWNTMSLVWC